MQQLVALDTNNDGKLDLAGLYSAVDAATPYTIVTWRGNGDGTFANATTLYTGTAWLPNLNAADVDQDGYDDLITSEGNALLIFRGTGNGFAAPQRKALNDSPRDITVGNFDGDSAPELVASAFNDGVVMAFDNVNGSFQQTGSIDIGLYPTALASADFNEDGLHDIVVIKRTGDDDAILLLYLRVTATVFSTPTLLPSTRYPNNIKTADFNGDGHVDFAVTDWGAGNASVYLNNGGTGSFTMKTIEIAMPRKSSNARPMLTDDLNGDGIADLAVAATNGGWLTTMTGIGDGTFRTPTWQFAVLPFEARTFSSLAAGDFDGDGDTDLAGGSYSSLTIANRSCTTQVTLTPKAPTITAGQDATLLIDVSGFDPGLSPPYGTATLKKSGATIGSQSVDADGRTAFVVSGLPSGEHSFTAEFSGNAAISAANSPAIPQRVINESSRTILSVPASPPVYGSDWPVTVTVEGPSYVQPEWVLLNVDGVVTRFYCNNPYVLRLAPGPHTIFAEFEGAYYRPPSRSETLTITALKASPALTKTAGATTVRTGTAHVLSFALTGVPHGMTGAMQLFSGNTLLASENVTNTGAAALRVTLPRGSHSVRAVYTGDANYNGASLDLNLHVLPDQPLWIDARALTNHVQILYVIPDGAIIRALNRRPFGDAWSGMVFDAATGIDPTVLERGKMYEYSLDIQMPNGTRLTSNVDGAMLFTDDPLPSPSPIKRTHITELRDALNLKRYALGLYFFQFDDLFANSPFIHASHLAALRAAVADVRLKMGFGATSFDATVGAGLLVRRSHIVELRELLR